MYTQALLILAAAVSWAVTQSVPAAEVQNNTFNATHGPYNPSSAQARIAAANLSDAVSQSVLTALNFERSNWAGTSVRLDPFYTDLPANWSSLPAGSVIKVEQRTNTSLYTIAATLAMSRILYTTKNQNGTLIPASAYVLWPWMPRTTSSSSSSGVPVIAWAHGTSGWSGECGPSHIRGLWYQFMIFTAATQGYAVVAPDYAGLGLAHDGRGNTIPHEYLVSQAHGNDLLFATKAAQSAWGVLDKRFVVMGHSQGGGAAWGAAVVLASNDPDVKPLRSGYLGSIAGSPWTSFRTALRFGSSPASVGSFLIRLAPAVKSLFPTFKYNDWLSDEGIRTFDLLQDLQGCQSVSLQLLNSPNTVSKTWNQSWYFDAFDKTTSNIAKPFVGPLLVIQGTGDSAVNSTGVSDAVDTTCKAIPDAQLEYVEFEGVSHSPVMFAGQQVILNWIGDRFEGKTAKKGCSRTVHKPLLSTQNYQKDRNWYLEWNKYAYGVA